VEQDNALIERVLSGNDKAFEEIVNRYQKRIFSLCYRMCSNEQDALDLSQEVFLRVYHSLKSFKGSSSFSTWVYRIASNICIDHLRKEKKIKVVSLTPATEDDDTPSFDLPDDTYSPEESYRKKELAEAISGALTRLSPDHRRIIVLRDINQLSYDEISEILDLEPGTVKSRIFRARDQLRKILLEENRNLFVSLPSYLAEGGEPRA
jgi:RNA polymerase sigma-70 factor (ECF subfamily)